MRDIFTTEQFRKDLDNLDKAIRERVTKTIRQIKQDPSYPGLQTHPQRTIPNRKIMRSRVNDNFRMLWEWLDDGEISLYRVAKHEVIDAISYLPDADFAGEEVWIRDARTHEAAHVSDWRKDLNRPQPFSHVPLNHLRLFGVPEDQLDDVRNLTDEEEIWELEIPENVQYTLYDILMKGEDWTTGSLLDTRQLLYRTTVDQLEGYCEGKIKRLLLNLTDEQMEYVHVKATGPILIKGVAGSGKTTIGLYRANYLAELIEERRRMFDEKVSILLLTYNKALARALKQLYIELYGELPYTITISTYDRWMLEQLNRSGIWPSEAKDQRRSFMRQAQNEIARKYPRDKVISRRSPDFLLDEMDDVIRARWLKTFNDYRAVNRVRRGSALQERHRALVWEICGRYQQFLDEAGLFDWKDLPRLAQKHCHSLPQYDVVIIDEAQDLPPSHLHLATRLLPDYSESRSLTLLADPAQSIYYRGIPWKEAGINIRGGRTRILAKNFRNTRQILEAARHILEGCDDLKQEDEYIPPTSTHRQGPKPIVASYENGEEANAFMIEQVIKLCQNNNYRPGDIAILARSSYLYSYLSKSFKQASLKLTQFRDDNFHILENDVKYITMQSAKGLEFPVVFMIGLDNRYVPYINKDSETKYEDELQERKLFYVSMTRAAERLYLLHPKRNRCRFLRDLDDSTVNAVSGWREKPSKPRRKAK